MQAPIRLTLPLPSSLHDKRVTRTEKKAELVKVIKPRLLGRCLPWLECKTDLVFYGDFSGEDNFDNLAKPLFDALAAAFGIQSDKPLDRKGTWDLVHAPGRNEVHVTIGPR